jgi:2-polyprenyl-3-methyl-5-hydroxy-6-metoxy-1,4-benzoquinol methylase
MLEDHLHPRGKILEVGAATGRYTLGLAQRGYAVTAVDLSPACLDECKTNLTTAGFSGKVQYIVDDARSLAETADRDFDVVLLMGPLYHLVKKMIGINSFKRSL